MSEDNYYEYNDEYEENNYENNNEYQYKNYEYNDYEERNENPEERKPKGGKEISGKVIGIGAAGATAVVGITSLVPFVSTTVLLVVGIGGGILAGVAAIGAGGYGIFRGVKKIIEVNDEKKARKIVLEHLLNLKKQYDEVKKEFEEKTNEKLHLEESKEKCIEIEGRQILRKEKIEEINIELNHLNGQLNRKVEEIKQQYQIVEPEYKKYGKKDRKKIDEIKLFVCTN